MKIYIGNLSKDVVENDLKITFEVFGHLSSVSVIKDKYTGIPQGFGFVDMVSDKEGRAAIEGLNGKGLKGQTIVVNQARSRIGNRGNREWQY